MSKKHIIYCSFCGKAQQEVFLLIAGPTVFICDECVELCVRCVADKRAAQEAEAAAASFDALALTEAHPS